MLIIIIIVFFLDLDKLKLWNTSTKIKYSVLLRSCLHWPTMSFTYSNIILWFEWFRSCTLCRPDFCQYLQYDLYDLYNRFKKFNLIAENEKCNSEVADNGIGMDGSVQRKRAYTKKVSAVYNVQSSEPLSLVDFVFFFGLLEVPG